MTEEKIVSEAIKLLAPDLKTTARYGSEEGTVKFGQICPSCGCDHKDQDFEVYNKNGIFCIKCPTTCDEIHLIWS